MNYINNTELSIVPLKVIVTSVAYDYKCNPNKSNNLINHKPILSMESQNRSDTLMPPRSSPPPPSPDHRNLLRAAREICSLIRFQVQKEKLISKRFDIAKGNNNNNK